MGNSESRKLEKLAEEGDLEGIELYLPKLDSPSKVINSSNAIRIASYRGYLDIVRYLYQAGGKFSGNDFSAAVRSGNLELVKFISQNFNIKIIPPEDLLTQGVLSEKLDVLQYLISEGVLPLDRHDFFYILLFTCRMNPAIFEYLFNLVYGIELEGGGERKKIPSQEEMVRNLIN